MKHSREVALTPMDVTGVPTNPMYERLMKVIPDHGEKKTLTDLKNAHEAAVKIVEAAGRVVEGMTPEADPRNAAKAAFHTYNRAIWDLAAKYSVAEPKRSRDDIDLTPIRGLGSIPIIVANSVNIGLRGVMAASRYGMTGTIMQEKNAEEMDSKLSAYAQALRAAHPLYREACILTPDAEVRDYWHYIQRGEEDIAIVVEGDRGHFNRDGKFLGIVGPDEIQRAKGRSSVAIRKIYKPAHAVLTAPSGIDARGVVDLLDSQHESFLPIMDDKDEDRVVGVTSKKSAAFQLRFKPHVDEKRGGLAYLVGLRHDEKMLPLIRQWIEEKVVGIGFKIDRAHLDRGTAPFRFIAAVRKLIDEMDPTLELHAGNVATGDGALRAADAGATGIWVGIGPSPVCVTREVTNYGVPQVTAVENVREAYEQHGFAGKVVIVADGGVLDTSGHLNAVKRAGADFAAGSTNWSKTRESSDEIENFKAKNKSKRRIWVSGNASNLVQLDSFPGLNETKSETFRRVRGPRREGDTQVVPMDPRFENYRQCAEMLTDGETSGVSFAGGDTPAEAYEHSEGVRQTTAGQKEGGSRLQGETPEY